MPNSQHSPDRHSRKVLLLGIAGPSSVSTIVHQLELLERRQFVAITVSLSERPLARDATSIESMENSLVIAEISALPIRPEAAMLEDIKEAMLAIDTFSPLPNPPKYEEPFWKRIGVNSSRGRKSFGSKIKKSQRP